MAIDVESIVIDTLLELVEEEGVPLERVTVKTLLERSGVSRQTFYNHFLDKNDLICQVYEQRMVPAFNDADRFFFYRSELEKSLRKMREHGEFLRQACHMTGQNNLCDHMLERARKFDLAWHQRLVDGDLPEGLRLATNYHVSASVQITIAWILAGFAESEESLADLICQMRGIGMGGYFGGGTDNPSNPYA